MNRTRYVLRDRARIEERAEARVEREIRAGTPAVEVTGIPPIRTVSCGCCAGVGTDPNRDRCTCHFHQDTPRGLPVRVCAYHAQHGHPHVTSPVSS